MTSLVSQIIRSIKRLLRIEPSYRPSEEQILLRATVLRSIDVRSEISESFSKPWTNNPGSNERAVFGMWVNNAVRHLVAVTVLAEQGDLALIAEVHFRQLLELLLQTKRLAAEPSASRDSLALKVAAWGCIDYLNKLQPVKNHPLAADGYAELSSMKSRFPKALTAQIESEMKKGKKHWHGLTETDLARRMSSGSQDLAALYRIASSQLHGSWDVALGVSSPRPGRLEFRPYPDQATLYRWSAELVDRCTEFCIALWNTVAKTVGAPPLDHEPNI